MIRTLSATLLLSASPLFAANAELKAAGQKLSTDHRDSIVWLTVISKLTMSVDGDAPAQIKNALARQDKENRSETTGTIVDAGGLIVTSLPAIDGSSVMDGKTINTPSGPIKLKASSEIKEVKIIMPDGTEIPADLVLKDADLGLGFIKMRMDSPEAKGVAISAINLTDSATGTLLDDCISLGRLDQNLNREASVSTSEISGITTKPRTFYRLASNDATGSGCPVYLASGKLLGLSVMRQPAGNPDGNQITMSPVILPAADVAKIAEQAKKAEPIKSEPKEEEGKKEGDKKGDGKKDGDKSKDTKKEEPKKEEPAKKDSSSS